MGGLAHPGNARITDQDVQLAERAHDVREDALNGLFVGGVQLPVPCLTTQLAHLLSRFAAGLRHDVGNRDPRTFPGEQTGSRAANPGGSPSDYRNLALHPAISLHFLHPSTSLDTRPATPMPTDLKLANLGCSPTLCGIVH